MTIFRGEVFVRYVRFLRLAHAAIFFTRITGFGENVIPLWRFWIGRGLLGILTQAVHYFWENLRLRCFRRFVRGRFHNLPIKFAQFSLESSHQEGGNASDPHQTIVNWTLLSMMPVPMA